MDLLIFQEIAVQLPVGIFPKSFPATLLESNSLYVYLFLWSETFSAFWVQSCSAVNKKLALSARTFLKIRLEKVKWNSSWNVAGHKLNGSIKCLNKSQSIVPQGGPLKQIQLIYLPTTCFPERNISKFTHYALWHILRTKRFSCTNFIATHRLDKGRLQARDIQCELKQFVNFSDTLFVWPENPRVNSSRWCTVFICQTS